MMWLSLQEAKEKLTDSRIVLVGYGPRYVDEGYCVEVQIKYSDNHYEIFRTLLDESDDMSFVQFGRLVRSCGVR